MPGVGSVEHHDVGAAEVLVGNVEQAPHVGCVSDVARDGDRRPTLLFDAAHRVLGVFPFRGVVIDDDANSVAGQVFCNRSADSP